MGKTADIVRPGTSASHPATYECAWGEDWHVRTGRVFDTTWPAGSGPRQVGQTSSPSLVPSSSSRLPTGTTAGAALQDEDGPRLAGLRRPARPHQARGAHVSLTTAARVEAMVGAAVKTTRWRTTADTRLGRRRSSHLPCGFALAGFANRGRFYLRRCGLCRTVWATYNDGITRQLPSPTITLGRAGGGRSRTPPRFGVADPATSAPSRP